MRRTACDKSEKNPLENARNIRLIVSDFDGTLLPEGQWQFDEEVFRMLARLREEGVVFAAASGRQYANMLSLMRDAAEDVFFLSENGGLLTQNGKILDYTAIDREEAVALIQDIQSRDGCEAIISGFKGGYVLPGSRFYAKYRERFPDFHLLPSLDAMDDLILKVTLYREEGVEEVAEHFKERYGEQLHASVSAHRFQDFMRANKGLALEQVCRICGIDRSETLAFGDNFNDLELFAAAGFSVASRDSAAAVREAAHDIFDSVPEYVAAYLQSRSLPPARRQYL